MHMAVGVDAVTFLCAGGFVGHVIDIVFHVFVAFEFVADRREHRVLNCMHSARLVSGYERALFIQYSDLHQVVGP